jgi:hypothetical protein
MDGATSVKDFTMIRIKALKCFIYFPKAEMPRCHRWHPLCGRINMKSSRTFVFKAGVVGMRVEECNGQSLVTLTDDRICIPIRMKPGHGLAQRHVF